MSGNDRKGPIPDGRTSIRTSATLSNAPNEDDGYDLQAMEISDGFGPSDGFRPTDVAQHQPQGAFASASSQPEPPVSQATKQRSSIAKPPQPRESLSLRHDGRMGPVTDSATASSAASMVRPESPYQGPSGPSFPYQMYPQNVRLARTASVATTSTAAISERSYNGPQGPTHPYQLYPQNTVPACEITPAPPVCVGFPGAADNYQRRLGPDGEEVADMIGPDGHTEQLPPYTRYPDEAYARKAIGIDTPTPASGSVPGSRGSASAHDGTARLQTMQAIPGAGGIGLATRNPEFASTDDLRLTASRTADSPLSRLSMRSFQSDVSNHAINTAAASAANEKPLKKWQLAARRKVCGVVPCWALCLTLSILIMLAVVLGAILGTFFGKHKPPPSAPRPSITFDASPYASVPSGLPTLSEGDFALPLMVTRNPNTCFNDTRQAQAWTCSMVFAQLEISISKLQGDVPANREYSLSFKSNKSMTLDSFVYSYGTQPPNIKDIQLVLVQDIYEPSRGPAWAFEVEYNKTVIIPEVLFSATNTTSASSAVSTDSSNQPRGFVEFGDPGFKRKGIANVGEKPWICRWDGTILETFIYVSQDSSRNPVGASSVVTTTPAPTTAPSATTGFSSSFSRPTDFSGAGFNPSQAFTPQFTKTDASTLTTITTTATSSASTNYFDDTTGTMPSGMKSAYPKVVKVEERRLNKLKASAPYCQQFEIQGDGQPATPAQDSSGNPIIVYIDELEPDFGADPSRLRREAYEHYLRPHLNPRDQGDMSDCGCMWWQT